jgi:nicotinate-nucleotide--dimethylbenzimidazole phosphoribosyltransferase
VGSGAGPGYTRAMGHDELESGIAALAAEIEPASQAHGEALRARASGGASAADIENIELAARLAAAQHVERPRLDARCIVVCAGDHGIATDGGARVDSELGLLTDHDAPTRAVLRQVAVGPSGLGTAAYAASATLVLVDCGMRGDDALEGVLDLRIAAGTADIRRGAAMSRDEAAASVRTGMALLVSLAENGLDVLGVGQVAVGARATSSAIIAALTGMPADTLGQADREAVAAALAANRVDPADPLAVLAALGGFEIGVLAGVMLAAASLRIPVVLDDHGTSAAALLAARWQPAVAGYLIAAHPGTTPAHRQVLRALGLVPLYGQAVSQGEGTGPAMALPLLDHAVQRATQALP